MSIDRWLKRYKWWRKWLGYPEPIAPKFADITREAIRSLNRSNGFAASVNRDYPQHGTMQ